MTLIVVPAVDDVGNILIGAEIGTPSSEASSFGRAFLVDGDVGPLFRFSAAAANANVLYDLNRLRNGGFETWPIANPLPSDGWLNDSSGTGAIARETTIVNAGGSTIAAKLTGGGAGNEARLRRDSRVMAGWAMTVALAIHGDATNAINIYIQNSETGKYLQSNETWTATKTAYATRSANTYNAMSTPATFTVEAASVAGRAVYTLRCWAEQVTGDGYVDDWFMWPHWDFAALFGHNVPSNVTARVRSDATAALPSPTNQVAFALRQPGMSGTPASMVTERFAQLYFDGTSQDPIEASEFVLAQKLTMPSAQKLPFDLVPDVGLVGGDRRPVALREDEAMSFRVEFLMMEADWDDLRIRLFRATRWGGSRTLIVPLDTRPGDVYYGTLVTGAVPRLGAGALYQLNGEFRELTYAVRTK